MQNFILVCAGTVIIGAMVSTSNMSMKDKVFTALAMIGISIFVGVQFTADAFWLIPCTFVGTWSGRMVNWSISKRRAKMLQRVMAENKTSL